MRSIATISSAKSGPPKGLKSSTDLPITMRSQMAMSVPDEFVALETTQAVLIAVEKLRLGFKDEDQKTVQGRT